MIHNVQAIVLAAGKSTRFNTKRSKLSEKLCGQEMILFPMKILESFNIPALIVVGYQKELVHDIITTNITTSCTFIEQKEQKGTGHAVECTKEYWSADDILILNGDLPLLHKETIQELYDTHKKEDSVFTFATSHTIDPRPNSYGKVVAENNTVKIVEEKDAQGQFDHCPINAGIYIVKRSFLTHAIHAIKASSATGEFYLTALPEIAAQQRLRVVTVDVPFDTIRGVNTLEELWAAETLKKNEMISNFMKQGVRFENPLYVILDIGVQVGPGSYIAQGVMLLGNTKIGSHCTIQAFNYLHNACVEDGAIVKSHSVIENSLIQENAQVGPFAYIHDNSIIQKNSITGHFVETQATVINENKTEKPTIISYNAFSRIVEKPTQQEQ